MYAVKWESSIIDLRIWDTVKLQIFVRYPFSYFWLETGSYELIFVLSKASKQNYIEIRGPQNKNKFSSSIKFCTFFNPLSAKLSFQVWYPGGQRLKVISFSWSGVKSPSKCFSYTESTSIIASRDEKRCYAAVQWNQIGALKFVTLWWPTPEVSRMVASLCSHPRCSLTDLQLCVNVKEKREVQNGSDIGSPKQAPKTRWFCERRRADTSRNHTLTSLCFLFLFWTMNHRKRLVPIATMIDDPSTLDLANVRKSSFHSSFRRTITKVLCSAWRSPQLSGKWHRLCFEKIKEIFKKNLVVIFRVRKKCPETSGVFKKSSKASSKPKAPELERLAPNLTKARETEKLFEMNITLERKEIFSSFERKSSLESLAQNIPEWPSPLYVRNLSFTHDGYIRHTATEMIFLMTDISVIWHSTG